MKKAFTTFAGDQVGVRREVAAGLTTAHLDDDAGSASVSGELTQTVDGTWLIQQDGIVRPVHMTAVGNRVWVSAAMATTVVERVEKKRRGAADTKGSSVAAPMTGRIVAVHVAVGDEVKRGQAVVVVEAMKMEQPLNAPRDGIVESVKCTVGQLVDGGVVLVALAKESA